jgi:hypothetical protein
MSWAKPVAHAATAAVFSARPCAISFGTSPANVAADLKNVAAEALSPFLSAAHPAANIALATFT